MLQIHNQPFNSQGLSPSTEYVPKILGNLKLLINLPDELWLHIFSYQDSIEVIKVNPLISKEIIWMRLQNKDFTSAMGLNLCRNSFKLLDKEIKEKEKDELALFKD